jgi:anti-anti-sigma regulatory factor
MQILHRSHNNTSIIYLDGSLNWAGIHQLDYLLNHSMQHLRERILLNLSGVKELDPECLSYLVSRISWIRQSGRDITLTALDSSPDRVVSDLAM